MCGKVYCECWGKMDLVICIWPWLCTKQLCCAVVNFSVVPCLLHLPNILAWLNLARNPALPSAPIKHWSFWNAEAWGKSAFLRMLYRCWWLDFLQNSAIATYLEYAKSLGSQRYWNEPSKPAWYIQSWIFPPNPAISKHLECTEGTPHRAEERLGKAQDNCLAQPWFICNISLVYVLLSV